MKQREAIRIDDLETIAEAIYEVDQDLVDEEVAAQVAAGNHSAMQRRYGRLRWEDCSQSVQNVCRRRARAALAAVQIARNGLRII